MTLIFLRRGFFRARHVSIFRLFGAVLVLSASFSGDSTHAINCQVFDCGDPFEDTACFMDWYEDGYFYGRSEGESSSLMCLLVSSLGIIVCRQR
jgi:hypothetical protein